jgi:hypothetical protein
VYGASFGRPTHTISLSVDSAARRSHSFNRKFPPLALLLFVVIALPALLIALMLYART